MRFFIILGLLVLIGVIAFRKASDTFWLKDAKKTADSVIPAKPWDLGAATSPPVKQVPGGSIATSIARSIDMGPGSQPEKPVLTRRVQLKHRNLPGPEFLSGLTALGVVAVVDTVSRSVMIRGTFDAVEEVAEMIEAGDVVPGSCAARGWVLWVSDSDADGWDLTAALSAAAGENEITGVLDGSGLLLNVGFDRVSAALEVLRSDSRVSLLQEPHVRLLDAVESRIESLEEVPIRSTTVSQGLATASIEYKRVGLEMVVKPQFLPSSRVRLDISQSGGLVGRSVEIDGAEVPVLQTQRVVSAVECAVGQTVILGGVRSSRVRTVKGFLKDTTETETGVLYVVLSLYEDAPRVRPVAPDWIPDDPAEGLLPAKGELGRH